MLRSARAPAWRRPLGPARPCHPSQRQSPRTSCPARLRPEPSPVPTFRDSCGHSVARRSGNFSTALPDHGWSRFASITSISSTARVHCARGDGHSVAEYRLDYMLYGGPLKVACLDGLRGSIGVFERRERVGCLYRRQHTGAWLIVWKWTKARRLFDSIRAVTKAVASCLVLRDAVRAVVNRAPKRFLMAIGRISSAPIAANAGASSSVISGP